MKQLEIVFQFPLLPFSPEWVASMFVCIYMCVCLCMYMPEWIEMNAEGKELLSETPTRSHLKAEL